MNKAKLNYFVDILLCISFVLVAVTGILKLRMVMNFMGWSWNQAPVPLLSSIHDWFGVVMVILVLVHLALHWKWIKCMTRAIFGSEDVKTCEEI